MSLKHFKTVPEALHTHTLLNSTQSPGSRHTDMAHSDVAPAEAPRLPEVMSYTMATWHVQKDFYVTNVSEAF